MRSFVLSLGDVFGGLMLKLGEWFEGLVILEIPDTDSSVSGSSKPLVSWVEFQIVDLRFSLEFDGSFFEVVDVPDVDELIFSSSGNIFTGWSNRKSINGTVMGFESVLDLEVFVPNFEESVPSNCGEVFAFIGRRISNSGNPVVVFVFVDCVFAITSDIPEFDIFFTTSRKDDTIIGVEAT